MKVLLVIFTWATLTISTEQLHLNWQTDLTLVALALPLNYYTQNQFQKLSPVSQIETPPSQNPLGASWSQKQYSETMQFSGNLLLWSAFVNTTLLTATASWQQSKPSLFFSESLVFLEALAYSSILNIWVRSMPLRPRPLVYNPDAPIERRTAPEASSSFYSGHASAAFLTATYSTFLFHLHYPQSNNTKWVALGSYAVATSVSLSRMGGGNHYLSDVLVGAAVGTIFGYVFPKVHLFKREKNRFSLNYNLEKITLYGVF